MMQVAQRTDWSRLLGQALVTACGFALLAYGSRAFSAFANMVSLILAWPTAFGLCMMLRLSRSRVQDVRHADSDFPGASVRHRHDRPAPSAGAGLCRDRRLIEILVGLYAVRRFGLRRFRDLRDTVRFFLAAIVAPAAIGSALAAILIWMAGDPLWPADTLRWFSANFLGFCIVLPFGLNLTWRQVRKLHLERRIAEAVSTFAAVTLVSVYVLHIAAYQMLFLILAVALIATARFRVVGAGAAMLIVLTLILLSPAGAHAPRDPILRIQVTQLFLAVTSLICARAAMVLNERELHLAIIERRRRRIVRSFAFQEPASVPCRAGSARTLVGDHRHFHSAGIRQAAARLTRPRIRPCRGP